MNVQEEPVDPSKWELVKHEEDMATTKERPKLVKLDAITKTV